jgi:peptide-methionine (S)-S-oxide reductase
MSQAVLFAPMLAAVLAGLGCAAHIPGPATPQDAAAGRPGTAELVLGGGCFWCVEAIFERYEGVEAVVSGYAGGHVPNPTYQAVCSGTTGHAEVVKVVYDPAKVTAEELLGIFFTTHDPTQLNRQGPDTGTQYRSVVFYRDEAEKAVIQKVIAQIEAEKVWPRPIVTTLEPLTVFYEAEEAHQDYYERFEKAGPLERMGMNAGYCANVIEPKVRKFREKYAAKLRKG